MLILQEEILEKFHRESQILQNEYVQICILQQPTSCRLQETNLEKFEAAAKERLVDVDYMAGHTRPMMPYDGDAPEVCLSARDKFYSRQILFPN